jgi:hypothetical protein
MATFLIDTVCSFHLANFWKNRSAWKARTVLGVARRRLNALVCRHSARQGPLEPELRRYLLERTHKPDLIPRGHDHHAKPATDLKAST